MQNLSGTQTRDTGPEDNYLLLEGEFLGE